MENSTPLDYSEIESALLGFKIGRCNVEDLNENILLKKIIEGKFDIVRLKVPAEDEEISNKLSNLNFPFYFSGSIRRYKTKISNKPSGDFINKSLKFEKYDGTQDKIFEELLTDTWGKYPLGYYRTPILNKLISKSDELKCLYTFYKHQNLNQNNILNTMMFMKDRGQYVGYFALNIIDKNLESHIGGIKKEFQKDGYFLDMLRYIKNHCIDENLENFVFGARNENALVQSIFHKVGFVPIGNENVFHITPFLNGECEKLDINASKINAANSFEVINQYLTSKFENFELIEFKWYNSSNKYNKKVIHLRMLSENMFSVSLFHKEHKAHTAPILTCIGALNLK